MATAKVQDCQLLEVFELAADNSLLFATGLHRFVW